MARVPRAPGLTAAQALVVAVLVLVAVSPGGISSQGSPPTSRLVLSYDEPAVAFEEALPLGNGRLGATVFGGPGGTDDKLNMFLQGKPGETRWQSEKTKSGKRKAWRYQGDPVPGRDFFGIDERDLDAAAEHLVDDVVRCWGFR